MTGGYLRGGSSLTALSAVRAAWESAVLLDRCSSWSPTLPGILSALVPARPRAMPARHGLLYSFMISHRDLARRPRDDSTRLGGPQPSGIKGRCVVDDAGRLTNNTRSWI